MWVWDILVLWTLGPWDPWTLEPLDLGTLGPLPSSNTSSYFPLHPLTSSYSPPLVWGGGGGGVVTLENSIDLSIDLKKLLGGWLEPWDLLLPSTLSSSNLLPPPSYSTQLLQPPPKPPPKPPPNSSYLLPKGIRWLISSYMKRFQYYSAQKSFMVGGGWHCNYSFKLQVQVSY